VALENSGRLNCRAVSIVSGGSRGLGLAVVERLLERGDCVATFSRSGSEHLKVLEATTPDRMYMASLDASDPEALREFVGDVVSRFGRIDNCVANAAIAVEGVLATMTNIDIQSMLRVNLEGTIVLVRECVRQMLVNRRFPNSSTDHSPAIVVLSSVVATRGSPGLAVYAATKAGLEGFSRCLAWELGPRGVRVNVVAPGFVQTDLSASLPADQRQRVARRTALNRLGEPRDIVGAVDFLTSTRAAFITGQVLSVNGGS